MSSRIEQPDGAPAAAGAAGAGPSEESPDGVPAPGEILAGKYKVERVLGIGGMGTVVAAMHLQLGERVALKFLHPSMTTPETMERFAREARAAARIKSEHIARVTDVGTLESGAPYMVMEFLEGADLSAVLRDQGPLPIRDAVEYIIQACDAVAEAHAIGIVHRDLKPANLFLSRRPGAPPRVKVLDFGISKVIDEQGSPLEQRSVTRTRAWLGSPLYMAPEQMKSARDVDTRTDVWALGVILFELLTRSVPFDGSNLPELCAEILHGKPAAVEDRRPEVPREIGDIIRRCLSKPAHERFPNVGELVMALVDYAPRRTRSVAERAVSVLEEAGIMQPVGQRHALDATMAESMRAPSHLPPPPSNLPLPGPPRQPSFSSIPQQPNVDTGARTMLEVAPAAGLQRPVEGARGSAWFVPLAVLFTLLASLGGVFAFLKYRDSEGTPPAASESAKPSAAPAPSAAPSVVPSASPATKAAAPVVEPSAAVATAEPPSEPAPTSTPRVLKGKMPTKATAPPAGAAPNVATPPAGQAPLGGDLRVETCRQTMPDGTIKIVPCK